MIKLTLLYRHPGDTQAFEHYYANKHLPLAEKMQGVARLESTKLGPGPDGSTPEYYRMAERYFSNETQLQTTLGSPEGQAATGDLSNFSTGGVTTLVGSVKS